MPAFPEFLLQMPEDSPASPSTHQPTPQRHVASPRRLRRWFVAGFLFVFLGMLLLLAQSIYTGNALIQRKLWQFYLLEIRRFFTFSGAIGPASGSGTQPFITLLQHLAVSCVGGLLLVAISALVTKNGEQ